MTALHDELHRTITLKALEGADPKLLREIFANEPDEEKVTSGLRAHADRQHAKLKQMAGIQPDAKPSRSQRVSKLLEESPNE